jgi:hypothetical protein
VIRRRTHHQERRDDEREPQDAGRRHAAERPRDEDADDRDREADRREQQGHPDGEGAEGRLVGDLGREPLQLRHRGRETQRHRRDDRRDVRLVDVGAHAGDVADVVTDVVGDDARVARVVLGDVRLDLPDDVGADVGGLRVDAAADAREEGDRAGTHRERVDDLRELGAGLEEAVHAAEPDQAEAGDAQTHDRPAVERHHERRRLALVAGGFGSAHVGERRGLHAEEAGEQRQEGAGEEAAARDGAELPREQPEHDERVDGEHLVLGREERHCALANEARDALHRLVALGGGLDAEVEEQRDDQRDGAGAESLYGEGFHGEFSLGEEGGRTNHVIVRRVKRDRGAPRRRCRKLFANRSECRMNDPLSARVGSW